MITWLDIMIRLLLAAAFGGVIGIERERKDWAAGLRTHMMVCLGACLMMIVSTFGFADILGTPDVTLDPSRIAAQVISGIGFIGAGTILFLRQEVIRGLTTAAGLWTVAGIGLATGGGMYFAALITTIVAFMILWLLKPVENKFFGRYKSHFIKIEAAQGHPPDMLLSISSLLTQEKVAFKSLSVAKSNGDAIINLKLGNIGNRDNIITIIDKLNALPGIKEVSWEDND